VHAISKLILEKKEHYDHEFHLALPAMAK